MSKMSKSYVVRVRCVVVKEVICDGGTAEEVRAEPWQYAKSETEQELLDWDVLTVEDNT